MVCDWEEAGSSGGTHGAAAAAAGVPANAVLHLAAIEFARTRTCASVCVMVHGVAAPLGFLYPIISVRMSWQTEIGGPWMDACVATSASHPSPSPALSASSLPREVKFGRDVSCEDAVGPVRGGRGEACEGPKVSCARACTRVCACMKGRTRRGAHGPPASRVTIAMTSSTRTARENISATVRLPGGGEKNRRGGEGRRTGTEDRVSVGGDRLVQEGQEEPACGRSGRRASGILASDNFLSSSL